jgi:hypothetical protein
VYDEISKQMIKPGTDVLRLSAQSAEAYKKVEKGED